MVSGDYGECAPKTGNTLKVRNKSNVQLRQKNQNRDLNKWLTIPKILNSH